MKQCAVVVCPNKEENVSGDISFHPFPTDPNERMKWLLACGLDAASTDFSRAYICSAHFRDEDFLRDYSRKKSLKLNVGPHLNVVKVKAEPHLNGELKIKEEPQDPDELEISNTVVPSLLSLGYTVPRNASSHSALLENSNFDDGTVNSIEDGQLTINTDQDMEPPEPAVVLSVAESTTTTSNASYIPSSLPASQNWPGPFQFMVGFGPQERNTKGVTWTFSKSKDKLYVGKDVPCPVNFSTSVPMPDNVSVRVMALYSSPEHVNEIVTRCVNHSMDEITKGYVEAEHLIRCESSMASYDINPTTKRHSVIVPFENPPAGQLYSTYIFKFACFGSCAGGPNRRPLMLIFTLEQEGHVIGRRRLDVKICACPGRDRRAEEVQMQELEEPYCMPKKRKENDMMNLADTLDFTKTINIPPVKKSKYSHNGSCHTIEVEDRGCYDFLKQMKRFYEMCKTVNNLPPSIRKALLQSRRKSDDSASS